MCRSAAPDARDTSAEAEAPPRTAPPARGTEGPARKHTGLLVAVVGCACIFCLLQLCADPPWNNVIGEFTDEANYTGNVQSLLKTGKWRVNWLDNVWACPLYQGLVLCTARTIGINYLCLRLLAGLLAAAVVVAVAVICARAFGSRHAMASVVLLSANPVFFALRRNFGPETGVCLFLLLGYWFLSGRGARSFFAAGACFVLAVGMKLSAAYGAAGALLFAVWRLSRKDLNRRELAALLVAPLAWGVFAALAYQANRHGWAINLALQRRVAQVQAVPLLQRFGRVLFACHTLRDPGFWLLLAAAFFWLPGWLHRALPQLLPARSEDANSRGIPDRSTAFTLALVCQCACLVAACLLSPENVNRRMVLLLPPLVVLAPLAFLGRKRDARRGPMAWPFLLLAALLAYYVGLLAVWSAQCYYAYFWLCRNAVDRTVAGVETPFPMWAALLLAVVVYLAVVLRRRQLRLIVGALALLAYAGWSCFTVGWCTLKPSYTVVEASVPLRRFVRRGDCMRFWLREGNQGFALCLENDATPMFMLGRTSLKAQRTDTSLAFRAYSITLRRRTTWRWAQSPLEAPVPEFDIEEELPVLRLIPNPLGVHSHDVRVLILKRRQPTE